MKAPELLSIIIPVYNEQDTVRLLVDRVLELPLPLKHELVIVDDGSQDKTWTRLQAYVDNPAVRLFQQSPNQGKGAALRRGFSEAAGDILVIQDADLEYDPSDIPHLLEPILAGRAEVVYGSRFMSGPRRVLLFWHMIGNKGLTLLCNMFSNLNLSDMETCYKAFRREVLASFDLHSNRFGFEPEFTMRVAQRRWRIYELPISYHGRGYEEGKKITWRDGVAALWTILKCAVTEPGGNVDIGQETLLRMKRLNQYAEWQARLLQPHLGKRVLELGAGTGNMSAFYTRAERLWLADVSKDYLKQLEELFAGSEDVQPCWIDLEAPQLPPEVDELPDTIVSTNVLEHIENDQQVLEFAHSNLSEGGTLALLVPATQAIFSNLDVKLGHHRRYTRKGLRRQLEAAGFEVESMRYLNGLGVMGWWFNGKVLGREILPRHQLGVMGRLLPLVKLEYHLRPLVGLSLLAVARKAPSA